MRSEILKEVDASVIRDLWAAGYDADDIAEITKLSAFDVTAYLSLIDED